MNEFIKTDFPGEVAKPMAAFVFLWIKVAARCFSFAESSDAFLMEDFEVEEEEEDDDRHCAS